MKMPDDNKEVKITHDLGCGWVVTIIALAFAAADIVKMITKS